MTREEFKNVMPIITAFVEGKTIQYRDRDNGEWRDICEQLYTTDLFNNPSDFRIKPEPTYRPFRNGSECWEEIQKHEPFGWVKVKIDPTNATAGIAEVNDTYMFLSGSYSEESMDYGEAFEKLTFIDGTPFGMKEE